MVVQKRDGRLTPFEIDKIVCAIERAMSQVGFTNLTLATSIADDVAKEIYDGCSVEEIQNKVEDKLIDYGINDVAKAYITYRYLHNMARNQYSELMDTISKKLSAVDVENQNANVDERSFGGRMGEATRVITKNYALNYCVSKKAKENHINNRIYIHDLDSYSIGMQNCLSIPFDKLLKNGFNTRQTDVRPANSVNTAFQLVAVIFQLQSLQQFGGVSATHLDWTMIPYVRKSFYKHYKDGLKYIDGYIESKEFDENLSIDDEEYKYNAKAYNYAIQMTNREVYQAVEGMYHNLNTLQSRSGNQLPFSSINFGTCTLPEGRMVIKALLEVCMEGMGKLHKTSIFPCAIFQYMKGVNNAPGTPNYDMYKLALKCTSKRLYPNYANVDWSGNKGYDINDPTTYFSTMGKRKLQPI